MLHYTLFIIHYSLSLTGCGWRIKHWKNFLFPRARSYIYIQLHIPICNPRYKPNSPKGIHGNSKIKTVLI